VRYIGHVASAEELLHLPACELVNVERPEVGTNDITLHCPHRESFHCQYKVMAVQRGPLGTQFAVYVGGEHQHEDEIIDGGVKLEGRMAHNIRIFELNLKTKQCRYIYHRHICLQAPTGGAGDGKHVI